MVSDPVNGESHVKLTWVDLNDLLVRIMREEQVCEASFDHISSEPVKIELAGGGRPAPAAHPGDCCGLPSPTRSPPTRSPDGSKRPEI